MNRAQLIKIIVVCYSDLLRASLKMLLETKNRFKVVGEASSFSEALQSISSERPEVVLLDLSKGDEHYLSSFLPVDLSNSQIITLTNSNDNELSQKYFELGVRGSVSKDKGAPMLFKAIEKVCDGEFWFDHSVMGQTLKRLLDERKAFYENPESIKYALLTGREKEVLLLIGKGLKNKEIAKQLFISENTVRHHLGSIFEKLNVAGRLELIVYAYKHNFVKST